MASPLSKKQKLNAPASEKSPIRHANGDRVARSQSRDEACEEEHGLIALVEHRGKEVDTIKQKLAPYQSMVLNGRHTSVEWQAHKEVMQSWLTMSRNRAFSCVYTPREYNVLAHSLANLGRLSSFNYRCFTFSLFRNM